MTTERYDSDTGLPKDDSYLECGLPDFLQESINAMQAAWDKLDHGEQYLRWDCDFCNLQTAVSYTHLEGGVIWISSRLRPSSAW